MSTGDPLIVVMNESDAEENGFKEGQKVQLSYGDTELYVLINVSNTEVNQGELGLFSELWEKYLIPSGAFVSLDLVERPESIDFIRKKMQGTKLAQNEIESIIFDISSRKIREVETAFFLTTFFNPGLDDEETVNVAKSMAKAGDILDFSNVKNNNGLVVDKHSIGGIAGKGITPILVPIIASCNLVIPNTSTRAITSPAGTTDILETVMPVALSREKLIETVSKTSGCMVWGGALNLAPADDIIISVERELHVQSYSKLLASIIAKKIAMGISHIVIDIPFGRETKVPDADTAQMLGKRFVKLFSMVGIQCETIERLIVTTDSKGLGPILEMKEVLDVLESNPEKYVPLENAALQMAGKLLEMSGVAKEGTGEEYAREKISDGSALEKFWEIALAQGAQKRISSSELVPGKYTYDLVSEKEGTVRFVGNKSAMNVCRALGTPFIKEAGMYFHKTVGDSVIVGEKLLSLYANSPERLQAGIDALGKQEIYGIGEE